MKRPNQPRHFRVLSGACAVILLASTVTACAEASPDDGKLSVLASFYPLQFVTQRIGGDFVTATSLTPSGAEPHDLELTPVATRGLTTTDLVVYLSGFQPSVDEAIEARAPEHVIDAASTTKLVSLNNTDEPQGTEHMDDDNHGILDPHFWLDPTRLEGLADEVSKQLSALDPAHQAQFDENTKTFKADLATLDSSFEADLSTCLDRTFITTHAAFGYLASRYDLTQIGISGIDPDAEPSPARMKEISTIVRDQNISTIFFETLISPKVAETLASDLKIKIDVLDPLESLSNASSDYFSVMNQNRTALRTALGCS